MQFLFWSRCSFCSGAQALDAYALLCTGYRRRSQGGSPLPLLPEAATRRHRPWCIDRFLHRSPMQKKVACIHSMDGQRTRPQGSASLLTVSPQCTLQILPGLNWTYTNIQFPFFSVMASECALQSLDRSSRLLLERGTIMSGKSSKPNALEIWPLGPFYSNTRTHDE